MSDRVSGGISGPLILAALGLILGLTVYGMLTGSATVADHGDRAPGTAQPFDLVEAGDDAKGFGADPNRLVVGPPATVASLLDLVLFTVAASGGLLPRLLRGPPARS